MGEFVQLEETVVIFDLDGTLIDSAPDLTAAMNVVLQSEGHAPLAPENVRHLVGHGARALLTRGFAASGVDTVSEAEMQLYIGMFIDYYKDHIADQSRPFAGCEETLQQLQAEGARLAVCTNKREELTYPLLDAFDLTSYFGSIICRDTLPVYKPDPAPVRACIERTNSSFGIMVGDTTTDLEAALRAEIPCLIAEFGYGTFSEEDMKKARPFSAFAEIPGLVQKILGETDQAG